MVFYALDIPFPQFTFILHAVFIVSKKKHNMDSEKWSERIKMGIGQT